MKKDEFDRAGKSKKDTTTAYHFNHVSLPTAAGRSLGAGICRIGWLGSTTGFGGIERNDTLAQPNGLLVTFESSAGDALGFSRVNRAIGRCRGDFDPPP